MSGALFLPSGAALVVYVVAGLSLLVALILALAAVGAIGLVAWKRASPTAQNNVRRSLRAGVPAAILATAAYDLSRYVLVESASLTFWPFDVFEVFGQALLSSTAQGPWITVAGIAFHVMNGLAFGIAYVVAVARPAVMSGVLWALLLEGIMIAIYPGWLDIRAVDEFLQVSALGHVVYGVVLGWAAARLLR